jgi:hypothetical protein
MGPSKRIALRSLGTVARLLGLIVGLSAFLMQGAASARQPPFGLLLAEDLDVGNLTIDRLHLGGWLDASYRDSSRNGDASSLAINHINGFIDLRFETNWQLFVESEMEFLPSVAGSERETEIEIEQLYLDYRSSDLFRVRVGSFSTPFGYWTPVHWTIHADTVAPPLHEARRYIPEQQQGGQLHGGRLLRIGGLDMEASYALYAGYGLESLHAEKARGVTGGADLRLAVDEGGFLGVSVYTQENAERRDRREISTMVYGELSLPYRVLLRGEYLVQRSSLGDRYRHAAYGKIRWHLTKELYLNYRLERADDEEFGFRAVQWTHRFTAGYWLSPSVRLKAEYARHDLRHSSESNFSSFALWLGIFF